MQTIPSDSSRVTKDMSVHCVKSMSKVTIVCFLVVVLKSPQNPSFRDPQPHPSCFSKKVEIFTSA